MGLIEAARAPPVILVNFQVRSCGWRIETLPKSVACTRTISEPHVEQASNAVPMRLRALGFKSVLVGASPVITFAKQQRLLGETVFDTPLTHLWVSSELAGVLQITKPAAQAAPTDALLSAAQVAAVMAKIAEIKRLPAAEVLTLALWSSEACLKMGLARSCINAPV